MGQWKIHNQCIMQFKMHFIMLLATEWDNGKYTINASCSFRCILLGFVPRNGTMENTQSMHHETLRSKIICDAP